MPYQRFDIATLAMVAPQRKEKKKGFNQKASGNSVIELILAFWAYSFGGICHNYQ